MDDDPWGSSPEREHVIPTLVTCFRKSLDNADERLKKKVASWFAKIIREESESVITSYGIAFLRASDMKYMDTEDAEIVKQHIFGQMKNHINSTILETLSGIGSFLNKSDIHPFIDPLVRYVCKEDDEFEDEKPVRSLLAEESVYRNFEPDVENDIKDRLEQWENTYKTRG